MEEFRFEDSMWHRYWYFFPISPILKQLHINSKQIIILCPLLYYILPQLSLHDRDRWKVLFQTSVWILACPYIASKNWITGHRILKSRNRIQLNYRYTAQLLVYSSITRFAFSAHHNKYWLSLQCKVRRFYYYTSISLLITHCTATRWTWIHSSVVTIIQVFLGTLNQVIAMGMNTTLCTVTYSFYWVLFVYCVCSNKPGYRLVNSSSKLRR